MNMPCATRIDCPCDSTLANLSAYDEDAIRYKSQAYSNEEPRIDHKYEEIGCVSTCQSDISQEDADLCAANQALQCVKDGETDENDDPVAGCWNSAKTGHSHCPDGNPFYYTLPAGSVMADNCALANEIAYSLATQRAFANMICLSNLDAGCCLGVEQDLTIVASGGSLPIIFTLEDGALPDGLSWSFIGSTISITGTPTTAGNFTFTFRATDVAGRYMDKTFTFAVVGITTASPLTDANAGTYYSQTLAQTGGTDPVQWDVISGSLPDGLDLEPTSGTIAGTPTSVGNYTLTVQMTDANNVACTKEFTLSVTMIIPSYYWDFEDSSSMVDLIGGTAEFTPSTPSDVGTNANGRVNNCVEMLTSLVVGVQNRYLWTATGDVPYAGGSFSGSLWVKWDDASPNYTEILSYDSVAFSMYLTRQYGQYNLEFSDGIVTEAASVALPIVANQWYHFLVWYDADTGLGGFEVDRANRTDTIGPVTLPADATTEFYVRRTKNAGDPKANSIMWDELAWFDGVVLSETEKDFLYNSGNGRTYPW